MHPLQVFGIPTSPAAHLHGSLPFSPAHAAHTPLLRPRPLTRIRPRPPPPPLRLHLGPGSPSLAEALLTASTLAMHLSFLHLYHPHLSSVGADMQPATPPSSDGTQAPEHRQQVLRPESLQGGRACSLDLSILDSEILDPLQLLSFCPGAPLAAVSVPCATHLLWFLPHDSQVGDGRV